jgi:hypothetical protein
MAAVSYWLVSSSCLLALAGEIRGWDHTVPTSVSDWRAAPQCLTDQFLSSDGRSAMRVAFAWGPAPVEFTRLSASRAAWEATST